jgi:hypothetical protein
VRSTTQVFEYALVRFGVTIAATAIAGPWSALYVKLPIVLAPLIRRVNRGSGGLKTPATDKSFAPSD